MPCWNPSNCSPNNPVKMASYGLNVADGSVAKEIPCREPIFSAPVAFAAISEGGGFYGRWASMPNSMGGVPASCAPMSGP